jgi:hypothetical protein
MRNKNRSLGALMTTVQPWNEPVKGKSLLDEIERVLKGHVVLPTWGAEALALWCVHTYAFELQAAHDASRLPEVPSEQTRAALNDLLVRIRLT